VIGDAKSSQATFRDTGAGMSAEVKEHLFEPFFTTKGMAGTGLGLSVSYGIIARHNGSISVESEPERGTTFTIQLPAQQAPSLPARNLEVASGQTLKILVVDDEDMVRETLVEYLELGGHQVSAASDEDDWLEMLKLQRFDVVITDLSMPKVDGYHVALVVKQGWPQTRILMATGYGDGIDRSMLDDGTIDDVINKPFNLEQINASLTRITAKVARARAQELARVD
jgi:CheY-like chemotaxis protein